MLESVACVVLQGIKLQYWLSAWDLFGSARAHASLLRQHRFLRFLPIRFEVWREVGREECSLEG